MYERSAMKTTHYDNQSNALETLRNNTTNQSISMKKALRPSLEESVCPSEIRLASPALWGSISLTIPVFFRPSSLTFEPIFRQVLVALSVPSSACVLDYVLESRRASSSSPVTIVLEALFNASGNVAWSFRILVCGSHPCPLVILPPLWYIHPFSSEVIPCRE